MSGVGPLHLMPRPPVHHAGGMRLDHRGMEILDEEECRFLLRRATIGRIVLTHHALPTVQPVNRILHDEHTVVRTTSASRPTTAATDTIVAFEIDDIDARTG